VLLGARTGKNSGDANGPRSVGSQLVLLVTCCHVSAGRHLSGIPTNQHQQRRPHDDDTGPGLAAWVGLGRDEALRNTVVPPVKTVVLFSLQKGSRLEVSRNHSAGL
jgi:hypothetical protein